MDYIITPHDIHRWSNNPQALYNDACRHLAALPYPSATLDGDPGPTTCRYRYNGRCCVAGRFLPDILYDITMENKPADGVADILATKMIKGGFPDYYSRVDVAQLVALFASRLMRRLQEVHDTPSNWTYDGRAMQLALIEVAASSDLSAGILDNLDFSFKVSRPL